MAIIGIADVIYGVEDLPLATRYFNDFGLEVEEKTPELTRYRLQQGASVVLRKATDKSLPAPCYTGSGVRELILGVDTPEALDRLVKNVSKDTTVHRDADGSAHFLGPEGLGFGLRLYERKRVMFSPDAANAPDNIVRFNQMRRWRVRARPKTINHVGFFCEDYVGALEFLVQRLNFRFTDHSRAFAVFARADGCYEHHTIFLVKSASFKRSGPGFHHTAFGVEDIDEIMAGANYMARQGWPQSEAGLGRHRISSALFWYHLCPAGGEAEYHADSDYVDDSWVPRVFEPTFGYTMWVSHLLPFQMKHPEWAMEFDPNGASLAACRNATKLALHASTVE